MKKAEEEAPSPPLRALVVFTIYLLHLEAAKKHNFHEYIFKHYHNRTK